jgi:hypothetical protein
LLALGEREHVEPRLTALEMIFRSFRKAESQRDPALVGVWHHWSYRSTGLYTSASTSSESRRAVQLGADGSAIERSSHEGIGNVSAPHYFGGYVGNTSSGRVGTWSAGDGMLFVRWTDGASAAWRYRIEGPPGQRRLLLFAQGATDPVEWTEQPTIV